VGDLIRDVDPSALHGPDSRKFEQNVVRAHMLGLSLEGLSRLRSLVEQRQRSAWDVGDLLVAVYGKPPAPGVMDGSREKLAGVADEVGVSISWLIACRITAAAWPRKDRRPTICWPVHRWLSAHDDRAVLLADFASECERAKVTPSAARLRQWFDPAAVANAPVVDPDQEIPDSVGADAPVVRDANASVVDPDQDVPGLRDADASVILLDQDVPNLDSANAEATEPDLGQPDLHSANAAPRPRPGRPRLDPVAKVERMALRLDRDALTALVHRLLAVLELQAAG